MTTAIGVAVPVPAVTGSLDLTQPAVYRGTGARELIGGVPTGTTGVQQGLVIGQNFGSRYHIIRLLGAGGMGAVYQAWDQVLEIAVALKVIRPESAPDAATAEALYRRFKHELLLARQVTHKNVVRIHDIGEIDGITYISMPYVHGSDLATIVKRDGRLAPERAIAIARELAAGLAAAHDAGVVHRDLKPANIMIDADGSVLIMDFGIARSTSGATAFGMTASGVIVGTVDYMAPEQAKGEQVDARADIYALGLILHDILLGRRQSNVTGVAGLMARMQQPPASMRSVDVTIPESLDNVVTRCLQPDPAARYQTMREVLADLDAISGGGTIAAPRTTFGVSPRRPAGWIAATVAAILFAGGGLWLSRDRILAPRAAAATVPARTITVAVLPFRNASGDATLDALVSSLGEVLRTELGQSSHVRTIPSNRLQQVLHDLKIAPNAILAPQELIRVADLSSARSIVSGQVTRFGNAIRIDATLQDLDRDPNGAVPLNAMAPTEMAAISELASKVRERLSEGSPDILKELQSTAWKPSTTSLAALRLYNEGVALTQQGQHQAALKSFVEATNIDSSFALAFSGLAQSYAALGFETEASQASRNAMALAEALPPQEKYRVAANHYRIVNDRTKAIEAYENLAKSAPGDAMTLFDLGLLYEQNAALDQALQSFTKVVEMDPKFVPGLLALGRVQIKGGNPQPSLDPLEKARTLAIQFDNDEARADILQAIGIAYMRLSNPNEALQRYNESFAIKQRLGNKRGMAASLVQIAEVQLKLGNPHDAERSYTEAEKLRREIGDKSGLSLTLIDHAAVLNDAFGRSADALRKLQEALTILRDTGNKTLEARALNNIGNVYMSTGQYAEAQTYFERSLEMRDQVKAPLEVADVLHNLGDTLTKMGRYEQALPRYFGALDLRRKVGDKRSAAIESYGIGMLFDYQGRYGAATKSKEEALRTFRELKQGDFWLGEILSGYGNSLNLSGRTADSAAPLDEALMFANQLQNANLITQTLRFQAERSYFDGDLKNALRIAEQAAQSGSRASDKSAALAAQVDLAMISAAIQPTKVLAAKLGSLAQEADAKGLKSLSVECAVQQADTLLRLGDRDNGRREVERVLPRADSLGLRVPLAKAHFVRASILRAAGDAEARREYAAALRLLDEIKREEGSEQVLKRRDLAAIHEESARAVAGS